jgi:uncharacterized protein YabE (DUF348 family)
VLRAVRPSPARIEAPEPDAWFPLGPFPQMAATATLTEPDPAPNDALLAAELELLELETGRADFDVELRALQDDFWSTAARRFESVAAEIPPAPAPEPEARAASRPARRAASAATGHSRRNRIVGTALLVAVLGAFAAVAPSMVGASVPQRDVTVSIDGQTYSRTVRAATVGEVLAMEGISLRPDDRVIPDAATPLGAGMAISVHRAFPVDVDVDGVITTVRTTLRTPNELRRDLGIGAGLVIGAAPRVLDAGTRVEFRTPHDVTFQVDGTTVPLMRTAALDVGSLLVAQGVALGPNDQVTPAPETRLTNGMHVRVFRLAEGEVAEQVAIPFETVTRDDPNLPVGQSRVIQPGVPGIQRAIFRVVTRDDGTVVNKVLSGAETLSAPVDQVVVKGTQAPQPKAVGTATHYAERAGTCAHLTLPFGTMVTVTNLDTGAVAQCRVADRGPEAWTGHIIDLTYDVFRRLAPMHQGIIRVSLSW